jgi:inosine-uridine nucleoside N-ribohydrolase
MAKTKKPAHLRLAALLPPLSVGPMRRNPAWYEALGRPLFPLLAAAAALSGCAAAPTPAPAHRTPVILITDLGTDIDDTWALGLALRSPELDLKLVLVDPADTAYRAKVAAKFLQEAGHADIPIAIGDNSGPKGDDQKTLLPYISGYELSQYPGKILADGVGALTDAIRSSPEPVTVVSIGPVHTLALALARDPRLAARCRLVGMYGSFDRGYDGGPPAAETNVQVNPAGLCAVLAAPWRDILLTPLDTCGQASLAGPRYHALWSDTGDPLVRAIIESYCLFAPNQTWMKCDFFATRSTTLFDCVAVYLAYSEAKVETETVRFEITPEGRTRRAAEGPFRARVALRWKDLDGFEAQLADRLLAR